MYEIRLSKQAEKDKVKLKQAGLSEKARELMRQVRINPYASYNDYEQLKGNLKGKHSRRINIRHRFVYEVDEANKAIRVLSMWSHYGDN